MKIISLIIVVKISRAISLIVIVVCSCSRGDDCEGGWRPDDLINEMGGDSVYIPYTGNEKLNFIVKDSLGNLLDTLHFIGKDRKEYFANGNVDVNQCYHYKDEVFEYQYIQSDDTSKGLNIHIQHKEIGGKFNIKYVFGYKYNSSNARFYGDIAYFYNKWVSSYHDSLKTTDTTYYQVIQLTTPTQYRRPDYLTYNSAYFGRYDGLVMLEETKNRIWYKLN